MITSRDIARRAGVSQATVSRVVQGSPSVSDATRKRVQAVMADLGYVPNAQARAMRTKRSGAIGIVTGQITNPFYPVLLDHLASNIAGAGLGMALWVSDGDGSESAAIQAIHSRQIDGLIFTTATADSEALVSALDLGLPLVLVNRSLDELTGDQVTSDNVGGGRMVARYFLDHGKTNVAVVGGGAEISTGRERRQSFVDEFARAGIEVPDHRSPESAFMHDDARRVGERLLAEDPPQAVFCVNDLVAFGVMDAARSRGLRVPEDLWVVGYDDIPMASWNVFDLTTVRQPIETMASVALQMLLARIKNPDAGFEHRRFAAELIVRGSTAHESVHARR
jgi:LacI family transcriptional regulator